MLCQRRTPRLKGQAVRFRRVPCILNWIDWEWPVACDCPAPWRFLCANACFFLSFLCFLCLLSFLSFFLCSSSGVGAGGEGSGKWPTLVALKRVSLYACTPTVCCLLFFSFFLFCGGAFFFPLLFLSPVHAILPAAGPNAAVSPPWRILSLSLSLLFFTCRFHSPQRIRRGRCSCSPSPFSAFCSFLLLLLLQFSSKRIALMCFGRCLFFGGGVLPERVFFPGLAKQ